jgi:hypothetical protein
MYQFYGLAKNYRQCKKLITIQKIAKKTVNCKKVINLWFFAFFALFITLIKGFFDFFAFFINLWMEAITFFINLWMDLKHLRPSKLQLPVNF